MRVQVRMLWVLGVLCVLLLAGVTGQRYALAGDAPLTPEGLRALPHEHHPAAIVLTCSDSRVASAIAGDHGLGDLFVVRTAGVVVDKVALESVEYAVEQLHTPLLVVLERQHCEAVRIARQLPQQSPVIAQAIQTGTLRVVSAVYRSDTGTVEAQQ
ncbi:MAG TPA: carbonic anhydrase [Armatimonadota bacterium]|jgi:hypothetical protein